MGRAGVWRYNGEVLSGAPHLWLSSAAIIGPGLTWWLLRKATLQMRAAAVMAVAALCAPAAWSSYFPILLPVVALGWAHIREKLNEGFEMPEKQKREHSVKTEHSLF